MRAKRALSALLVLALLQWALPCAAASVPDPEPGEKALLLRYVSPDLDPKTASDAGDAMRDSILSSVPSRWLPAPRRDTPPPIPVSPDAEASPAELAALAGQIRGATELMEKAEGEGAERLLSTAEEEARRFSRSAAVAPYLSDIFLRRGILGVWKGDADSARRQFARVRTLAPAFRPDPALFSPPVLEAWDRSAADAPLPAVLLLESVPSGAEISVDGKPRGRTPARVALTEWGPHSVVLLLPGHRSVRADGVWLPGDEPSLSISLPMDPAAAAGELVPREGEPVPSGLAPLLSSIALETGAVRICVLVLVSAGGGAAKGRILSWTRGEAVRDLGFTSHAAGKAEGGEAGREAARILAGAGWPSRQGEVKEKPWYHRSWFLAAMGVVAAGTAALLSGGGGSGSSSGSLRVNF